MVGREGLGIQNPESPKKKVVGEPYEGKPHVRFEVAGDGNQDMVRASEALPEETGSNRYAQPKSQAPSPDPTSGPGIQRRRQEITGMRVAEIAAGRANPGRSARSR